jgi:colanic acid/amylovoran biosynthesis glycosyltransferase
MTKSLRVAYLAPEMGGVTHTFIHREMAALEALGVEVVPFATVPPNDSANADETRTLRERTLVLYKLPPATILLMGIAQFFRSPIRMIRAKFALIRDIVCAQVPGIGNRFKLIGQFYIGAAFANELVARKIDHLHVHFAHVPATVGMYASLISGVPYSFTAHANDIFVRPVALKEKVARATFCACISEFNVRFLTKLGCNPARLLVVRCGLDTSEYAYETPRRNGNVLSLFSVGRLVEKKGFHVLIGALARVQGRGVPFNCRIVGSGPLEERLRSQIAELGLANCVHLLGSQPQHRVKELLAETDVFVLACVVARDGDQDGIPVALMEAMALGIPVISTEVSGIPELIQNRYNGLLAKPDDDEGLADCIVALAEQPQLIEATSLKARSTIENTFNATHSARELLALFTKES